MLSLMPDEAQLGAPVRYSGGTQRLPAPGEAGPAYAEDSQCMPAGHPGLGVCRRGLEGHLASLFTFETKSFGQVSWPLCQVF